MALSGISANVPLYQSTAPAPLTPDDTEDLKITDPDTMVKQQIIEQLFSPDKEVGEEHKNEISAAPEPVDTVEISSQAIELHARVSAEMSFETPDGTTIRVSLDRKEFASLKQTAEVKTADPLVLDLDGNGIRLTDATNGGGARFDINGDGRKAQVSWVAPTDGFLAYDRNGNGTIDSGKELFGDQHGSVDGFAELGRFDTNRDGIIDRNDRIFGDLRVWQDKNGNGVSEEGELKTLEALGITALSYRSDGRVEVIAGNRITGYSSYSDATGRKSIGEAWLNFYA